jgi:hypothetical protein
MNRSNPTFYFADASNLMTFNSKFNLPKSTFLAEPPSYIYGTLSILHLKSYQLIFLQL